MIEGKLVGETEQLEQVIGQNLSSYSLKVTTDSRKLVEKNCFIALYGEKFDAFNFVESLLSNQSLEVFIIENKPERIDLIRNWSNTYPSKSFILVKDIYKFILELGNLAIKSFKSKGGKVIGLTGSNGKTTNKEILAYLLSEAIGEDKVHFTKGNLNNHIGVPLTIFDLMHSHEVAIIEMGTNHPGEIEILCSCAEPDFGMITNIGHAHIEYLLSLDGVLAEKASLYKCIARSKNSEKCFILNSYDEKLNTLNRENWVLEVSTENTKIEDNSFSLKINEEEIAIENPFLLGRHQQINMAMGMTMALHLYPSKNREIINAARTFELKGMNRGEIRSLNSTKIYLDAYNANPSSMIASLNSFKSLLLKNKIPMERTTLILGDMNEIGDEAQALHISTALKANELGFSHMIFVGRYAQFYKEGFGAGLTYKDASQLKYDIQKIAKDKDFLFIKGSRSLQLESILDITSH